MCNGYASTICMMLGPTKVPNNTKALAGNIMVLCLLMGLAVGSFVGIGLSTAIIGAQTCNDTVVNATLA